MIFSGHRTLVLCSILLLLVPLTYGDAAEIRILHVNDFHGFAEPYQPCCQRE